MRRHRPRREAVAGRHSRQPRNGEHPLSAIPQHHETGSAFRATSSSFLPTCRPMPHRGATPRPCPRILMTGQPGNDQLAWVREQFASPCLSSHFTARLALPAAVGNGHVTRSPATLNVLTRCTRLKTRVRCRGGLLEPPSTWYICHATKEPARLTAMRGIPSVN